MTKNKLTVFADGGARGNPGPAAWGFLINQNGSVLVKKSKFIGKATNNIAEYKGVLAAATWLYNFKKKLDSFKELEFFLDSQLVVNQLKGEFKIKNQALKNLVIKIKIIEAKLKDFFPGLNISYHHIPREKNKQADKLLNTALNKALTSS
jgi:ribonuclease HI